MFVAIAGNGIVLWIVTGKHLIVKQALDCFIAEMEEELKRYFKAYFRLKSRIRHAVAILFGRLAASIAGVVFKDRLLLISGGFLFVVTSHILATFRFVGRTSQHAHGHKLFPAEPEYR